MFESKYLRSKTFPKRFRRPRIFEIDFMRGFDIILMILIHLCFVASGSGVISFFDKSSQSLEWVNAMNEFFGKVFWGIVNANGIDLARSTGGAFYAASPATLKALRLIFLEVFFSGLFVFLSGISCSFTRNNAKRGLQLAYVAEIMTVLLFLLSGILRGFKEPLNPFGKPEVCIILGILQSIAIALLVYALFDHFFPKYWQTFLAAIFLTIIAIITSYYYTDANGSIYTANLPEDWWKLLLGLARYGEDYFSPTQICAVMFLGASFGKVFYRKRQSLLPSLLPTKWARPILFLGRHSLVVYILHQPLIYLFFGLFYLILGYRF